MSQEKFFWNLVYGFSSMLAVNPMPRRSGRFDPTKPVSQRDFHPPIRPDTLFSPVPI